MTADLIQYASISGELAKNLWGRSDFQKYDSGWAQARNWFVDYHGGLFNRAGFVFGDYIERAAGEGIKFAEFQFSPDIANTYLVIFTDEKIRFVQDNAYVLEDAVAVSDVNVVSGSIRITFGGAHGYSTGDLIKLSGFTDADLTHLNTMTVFADVIDSTNIELTSVFTGANLTAGSITYTSGGNVYRVYTVTSPYGEEDLEELSIRQVRDYFRLTHPDYSIRNLVRNDATDWALEEEDTGNNVERPSNISRGSVSADSNRSVLYMVTAVDLEGNESLPAWCALDDFDNGPTFTSLDAFIQVLWEGTATAQYYNVYRSNTVANNIYSDTDAEVGYVGKSYGTMLVDKVTSPDFSKKPPVGNNPFADAQIEFVQVIDEGSGYNGRTAQVDDPAGGSGFIGYFITRNTTSTTLNGVKVVSGGSGYTGTTIGVTDGGSGTGFEAEAHLSAATGNNPRCSAIYQQRQLYAGTTQKPLAFFGSKPGLFSNFDISDIQADDDAFEFDLDAEKLSPILHIVPVRSGVLVLNSIGVWLVYGRGNSALTANNAQSDLQNAVGCTFVQPIYVDSYVLYVSDTGQDLRMLAYDDYAKVFAGQNVSLLSNHLFSEDITITSLTYAEVPFKFVAAAQSNGRLLLMTLDNENKVYAVCPQWTKGKFLTITRINENQRDRLYVAVERTIDGNTVTFFERMAERKFTTLEEAFFTDAGLSSDRTYPSATLTPSSATGTVTFTASASVFSSGDVGKVIRCGSGKATISSYSSGTEVTATWSEELEETEPESTDPKIFASGEWTMDATFTTVSGLWHLEGEEVTILADGEVVTGKTVSDGEITLDTAASVAHIGLAYSSVAQTLPLTASDVVIEGRRKNIKGISMRINETYGVKVGASLSKLYEIHDRAKRLWGTAARLRDEMLYEVVSSLWSRDNQLYIVQDSPRPAGILNFIRDTDLGDDKD